MSRRIQRIIEDSISVKKLVKDDLIVLDQLSDLTKDVITCLKNGRKVIFAGNGGSFADAQHLSAEFVSRFMFDRTALPSVVLGANNSSISAIGNDYGYDQVFSRELSALGQPGDMFIPISTSGNSPNILKAIDISLSKGIKTVGLSGAEGGKMAKIAPCIKVPSSNTARIQESHIMIGHILCELVEKEYFKNKVQ